MSLSVVCQKRDEYGIGCVQVPYTVHIVGEEGAAFGGGVGDKVNALAEDLDATLIVVAAHRKSALAEFIMGSISNFLVHSSLLPVLVLHAPRKEQESHLGTTGTRHIVLGGTQCFSNANASPVVFFSQNIG